MKTDKIKIFEIPTGHKKMPAAKIFKHKNDKRNKMKIQKQLQEF